MMTKLVQNIERLRKIEAQLYSHLDKCALCPRKCGVNRRVSRGLCGAGAKVKVALFKPFMYEEPPLSGTRGAGNVFFSHCNLKCLFCQNHEISAGGRGVEITTDELADIFIRLQERGCHNVNLVSPAPYLPLIITAFIRAFDRGFDLPVVYNTNGYELPGIIEILSLFTDIFLPDVKYATGAVAEALSGAYDYPDYAFSGVMEMINAAGHLEVDEDGVAVSGVIARHLVLPGHLTETGKVLERLRKEAGKYLYLGLMSQYTPVYQASGVLGRRLEKAEYENACNIMSELGFVNGWTQELESAENSYIPVFVETKMQLFSNEAYI